ncbi:MAG: aminopeptidase P family protein, partial [Spirochaetaceae bacterium]|nr:aminopeptidase P family protein [Spirochaetaceae bacterium]
MRVEVLQRIQEAIRTESLDGWIFSNIYHRDRLSDAILHISQETTNSRLWVYAVPDRGEPQKLVHAIEAGLLAELPGHTQVYHNRDNFFKALMPLKNKTWGAHISETLPAVSYLDVGTARVFEKAGMRLVSAAALIQRFKGVLDAPGIAAHERVAEALCAIVAKAWDAVQDAYTRNRTITEGDLRALMVQELQRRNLVSDHPPLVAAGPHSGNPHYDFFNSGAPLREGDVVQFDLWAKEKGPEGIYADISWAGVFGVSPPEGVNQAFRDLVEVREEVYRFIAGELAAGRPVSGTLVDSTARERLTALGYAGALKHRTGHGIDTECHGCGVNMDAVEFPDSRCILEGSCFSLEPGVYFADFGLRTEINVYIWQGKPEISGKDRQFALLTCAEARHPPVATGVRASISPLQTHNK